MDAYRIREVRDGDEESLLETFNAVFSDAAAPRTRAQWDWAFARNPAGKRAFVAEHAGRVVAQYAALPSRVWIDGAEHVFAQIVDSMVHPSHRTGLKRPGLFVRTAEAFFAEYGGPERDWIHYGWPIDEAWRVGQRLLGYELVRPQLVLAREVAPRGARKLPEHAFDIERFDEQVRWLWDRCASEYGASTLRDAEYMNWRFVDRPNVRYERIGVEVDGVLRGCAVMRCGDWPVAGAAVVADWLVPQSEVEVGDALLAALESRARECGARQLIAAAPEWHAWFAHFQERAFTVHATAYPLAARSFHPRFDALWLRDHWWYQLGDSDLV
jgi:L-amino acid N-acyltransferase YncA